MSLKYTGFVRVNGPQCDHLNVSLTKDGTDYTVHVTADEIDEFIDVVATLVPGLSSDASALGKRVKAKLFLDLAYYRAEGKTFGQIRNTELEVL